MKKRSVLYIFRAATGGFSIERVFYTVMNLLRGSRECSAVHLPNPNAKLLSVIENLRFIRKCRSDIYHITGDVNYVLLALAGRKTVLTVHDCCILNRGGRIRKFIFRLFWFYLPCKIATRITCISEKSRTELLGYVPGIADKVSVIPDPLPEGFGYDEKVFNAERPRILHFNMTPNKNLDKTIIALKDIPCELVIIGQLTEDQRRALSENKIDHVNMFNVSDAEILKAYKECDLLCFPSTYEGFGMPIIEAQAVGRAVVTSDLPPMNQICGGGAVLIDPGSPESIRDGVLRTIRMQDVRDENIAAGLENVKRFSAKLIADEYGKLYDSI